MRLFVRFKNTCFAHYLHLITFGPANYEINKVYNLICNGRNECISDILGKITTYSSNIFGKREFQISNVIRRLNLQPRKNNVLGLWENKLYLKIQCENKFASQQIRRLL